MNRKIPTSEIEKLILKIASPEEILSWSKGEVLRPETINYRTGKPERAGLFSEVIFGPMKDFECACGKYKKPQIKGITCERCGVEIIHSSARRERMGHITLISPVAHIWFLKVYPYPLKIFLDIPLHQLEKVIYYSAYIITRVDENEKKKLLQEIEKEYKEMISQSTSKEEKKQKSAIFSQIKEELNSIQVKKVLSDAEYYYLSRKYPNTFEVGIGAEPIRRFLEEIDLEQLKADTLKKISKASSKEKQYLFLKLKFINAFIKHNRRPEWMILTVLPVIPPDLRPIVQLAGGQYTSSDLNDLYRRIINRNNRLRKLLDLKTPEIIFRNEKRMLQDAVDSLIDLNMKKDKITIGRKVIKSLADILKGKEGRFRQNLLGKRVDYSGRSVIVIGPELRINECGLPKKIAFELFKPFVIHELLKAEKAQTTKHAKHLIEIQDPEAVAALEKAVQNKYVLLNRAPTLHKLGILSFKPILIEGLAIRIPPLVCEGYNADFDGDQMGVFLLLSEEAQEEAREILDAGKNLLRPGTGEPVAKPQRDIIIGLYYLTLIIEGSKGENKKVYDAEEALYLYSQGYLDLHAKIFVKHLKGEKDVETSVGRIIFNNVLPYDFPFVNQVINKKAIGKIVSDILARYDLDKTAIVLDSLKELGFKYVTLSGLTLGIDDLVEPSNLQEVIKENLQKQKVLEEAYDNGWISELEKKNQLAEIWNLARHELDKNVQLLTKPTDNTRLMIDSGGRGSIGQLSQMVAIKGLVSNPKGEIIDLPILSSFKKGLTPAEYFISTHGARKGVADKALKTPKSGYLTRRLVDALHDVIIRINDCGDNDGLIIDKEELKNAGDEFKDQIYSRISLETVKDQNGNILVNEGDIITKEIAAKIDKAGVTRIKVRSPFSCKALYGLCQKCFGLDLSNDKLIKLGEAVGIVAAQSIGEPGTQLTMRTFHYGGVVGAMDITTGLLRVEEVLEVRTPKSEAILSPVKGKVKAIEEAAKFFVVSIKTKNNKIINLKISKKFKLLVKKGDAVVKGQVLNEGIEDPKKIYRTRGKMAAFQYMLSEVKRIYNEQGASIHNKYLEIVIKKMFSRVRITDPGDSEFIINEVVEKDMFWEENLKLKRMGKKPAKGILMLMGIKNIASSIYSFLSAASFQETSRALVRAALECREDTLRGVKENFIIGRKPTIGNEFRKWLKKKDQVQLSQEGILSAKD
ncbi:MAG: DNA-directed RNA polymerase subunit beta' [Candidatus Parcubacteria bacterium]|nr:MAG: DNA-directed RNA polymerase subunit beta' [Candidatus Parcubacteria bacterium]